MVTKVQERRNDASMDTVSTTSYELHKATKMLTINIQVILTRPGNRHYMVVRSKQKTKEQYMISYQFLDKRQ